MPQFLETHSPDLVPETIRRTILELGSRAETVQRVEEAFLVELASETDAALIARDSEARKYCRLAGAKHVALPKRNYRAFRNTIKKLGFIIPDVRLSS
jgi:hypothetical protein